MTRAVIESILVVASLLVLFPAVVVFLETFAALLPPPGIEERPALPTSGISVLIPAHNEAGQIRETVRLLAEEMGGAERILVVADNCGDDTAPLAASMGATVIERHDPTRIGKGFAISFGLAHLRADPPQVVIIIDADCRISTGGIAILARAAAQTRRPVQAEYVLGAPEDPSPLSVVSALAVLLRNQVRPRGLLRLGLPCLLTGSGMAFPWQVLRDAPETKDHLVEDMVIGIELALRGHAPLFCPQARITSELPTARRAGLTQRRRWEHGHIETLLHHGPRLLAAGIARGRPALLGLALDLMVPPLALLVMLQVGALAVTVAAAALGLTAAVVPAIAGSGLVVLAIAVGMAWLRFGRSTLPLRYALFVPVYLLWKVPLYVGLTLRGKQKKWERTARRGESEEGP